MANADDRFAAELTARRNGLGDVEIAVNDKSIKTHRAVLTHHSDYFKTMFEGGFAERTTSSVDLSNVFESVDELNNILDFMYTGTMKLSEDNILSVLNAASLFLLSDLQAACSEFLIVNVAPSTCISIFIVAERYCLKELQGVCVEVIRSWFPFTLYESQEAIEMPPECLKILIAKKVIGLLSDETRETFLLKWHEHFLNRTNGNIPLPKEVEDVVQANLDGNQCTEGAHSGESKADEDELEEVVFTLMVAPPPGSDQCCVELHAFAPRLNTWKLMIRHAFCELVKPKAIPTLIGVSQKKAFFLFRKQKLTYQDDWLLFAVDLQSKEESVIRIPTSVLKGSKPHFFLWNDHLCAVFLDRKGYKWILSKNKHEGRYGEVCYGECWEYVCDMPKGYGEVEYRYFLTKAFHDQLYVAMTCLSYGYSISYYCITKSQSDGGKCQITVLPSPEEPEDSKETQADNSGLHSNRYVDSSDSLEEGSSEEDSAEEDSAEEDSAEEDYSAKEDSAKEDSAEEDSAEEDSSEEDSSEEDSAEESNDMFMSSISLDSRSSLMQVILKKDSEGNKVTDLDDLSHKEHVHTLDVKTNEWKSTKFCKKVYPEDFPGPLKADEDDDYFEYGDYPFRNPYTKTDEEDDYDTEIIGHLYTHELVVYEYYMRHTSPYNTSIWRLEPEGEENPIVTHLPYALYKFQGYLPGELRLGFFKTFPKAAFHDYSEEIGHSAVAYVYPPSAEFQLVYNGRLLAHKDYEDLWGHLWQESIQAEKSMNGFYAGPKMDGKG